MAAIKPESGRGWGKTVRSQNNLRAHIKKHRKAQPEEAKKYVLITNPEAYCSDSLLKYINDNNITVILDEKVSIGTILYQPEKKSQIKAPIFPIPQPKFPRHLGKTSQYFPQKIDTGEDIPNGKKIIR